ncbi:MAG TPA: PAS domain-containing protein, partial [Holophaga sp.]|nr:PAS domain-containing protein [Holophaga sp.]
MSLRTWASPKILLGLFLANTLFLVWLAAGQARPLALTALLVEAALGLFLFSRLSGRAKEADDALERADRYIQGVADLSLDVQSIINAQHQSYLYMNSAVEKVLGYKSEEFIEGGLDFFYSILHPEDLPQVRRGLERMMDPALPAREDDRVQEEIYRVRNKWDEYRWFRSRRMVFTRTQDGAPRDLLVVARDFTEQRGFELALVQAQEFESLGILARRLAHDLNNILMGIQGYVELGLDGKGLPPEAQEKIREGTGRATEICRQMLAFAGRGRLQLMRHQLNDALREGLPVVESLLPENVQLTLELEPDLPRINADPNQIRYALLNLVVNAMETLGTREGEIVVRTGLKHLSGDGEQGLAGFT